MSLHPTDMMEISEDGSCRFSKGSSFRPSDDRISGPRTNSNFDNRPSELYFAIAADANNPKRDSDMSTSSQSRTSAEKRVQFGDFWE